MAFNCGSCIRDVKVDLAATCLTEQARPLQFDNAYCIDAFHALIARMLASKTEKDAEEVNGKASVRSAIESGDKHWGLHAQESLDLRSILG